MRPHEVIRYHVEYCGALVRITGPEDEVGLIHQSVKDYLLREHPSSGPRLDIFRFDQGKLNGEITNTCLKYLHNCFLAKDQVRILGSHIYRSVDQASLERFPFLSYATLHWPEHAQHSSGYDFSLPFFTKSSPSREAWSETYWALEYGSVQPNPPPTLLHLAAMFGLFSLAEKLLSGGIRKRLHAFRYINQESETPYQGTTPLASAAGQGHEDLVRLLLKNRAKINFRSQGNACSPALRMAATHGHVGIAQLLLKSNAYVNSVERHQYLYTTPLIAASANGHERMVRLLLQAGAYVNPNFKNGSLEPQSALGWASLRGHTSIVQLLLENEADIENKNDLGYTPLINASWRGHDSTVRLLLENGADIKCKKEDGQSALMQASKDGHESTVRLLLENGADRNCKDIYDESALMMASYRGHESTVRLLLENGANINDKNNNNNTALMLALLYWNKHDIEDVNFSWREDKEEYCALKHASYNSIVRLLLKRGADTTVKNSDGYTALDFALGNKHDEIVRLLREREGH